MEHKEIFYSSPFRLQVLHGRKVGYIFTVEHTEIHETDPEKIKAQILELKMSLDVMVDKIKEVNNSE